MFERTGYIMILLFDVMLSATTMSSCINESDAGCVQYAARPGLIDSDGNEHSDTAVKSIKAYLFSEGKFDHEVKAESDGRFLVSFDGTKNTSLVMLGYPDNDSLSIKIPKEGEDIGNTSSLLLSSVGNLSPEGFYYGRLDYTISESNTIGKEVIVSMYAQRATIQIVVENLTAMYGSGGNYSIKLSGLRNAVDFDGTICGDSVTYSPKVTLDTNGNLCSEELNTLPTKKGEKLTVAIYRDGILECLSSRDNNGDFITLSGGDNKTVVIDVKQNAIFTGSTIDGWQYSSAGSTTGS